MEDNAKAEEGAAERQRIEKEFEQCCNDYGQAIKEDRHLEAEAIAMRMMHISMLRAATEEPSQTIVWMQMADQCEEQANWAGAEQAHRNAIATALAEKNREFAMKPHLDLAGLYEMLGRDKESMAEINAAVELVKDSEITILCGMALEAKAKALLSAGETSAAKDTVLDALRAVPDDKLHALVRARLMVLGARCEAMFGEMIAAEKMLSQARELTQAYADSEFLGGLQSFFAQASEVSALILESRGMKSEALANYREALTRIQTMARQPHLQGIRTRYRLAKTLERYANYLEAAGSIPEAFEARQESEGLLRALRLSDR
jgi:tetratricopeptide (TPR) repeat protein